MLELPIGANDNEPQRYGPWPTTKELAKKLKSRFFFSGAKCKNGHLSERYVSDGKCVVCKLAYRKAYYYADPEKARATAREDHHKNRDRNLSRMKSYAINNKEKLRETRRSYRNKNRDRRIAQSRQWYADNKEHARRYQASHQDIYNAHARNRRARIHGNGGSHTAEDIARILEWQKYRCAECKISVRKKTNRHVDHIMPIALGGSNDKSNLQVLCPTCNLRKNAKHPLDFAKLQGRLL